MGKAASHAMTYKWNLRAGDAPLPTLRAIPVDLVLFLFEADGNLGDFRSRRQDRHRLVVAPRGQGDVGCDSGRLSDGLDLTAFASRAAGNATRDVSARLLPRAGDLTALIGNICGQVEIIAVAGASQPQRKIPRTSGLKSGTATDASGAPLADVQSPLSGGSTTR